MNMTIKETELMSIGSLTVVETHWENIPNQISLCQNIPGAPGYSDEEIDCEINEEEAKQLIAILQKQFNL